MSTYKSRNESRQNRNINVLPITPHLPSPLITLNLSEMVIPKLWPQLYYYIRYTLQIPFHLFNRCQQWGASIKVAKRKMKMCLSIGEFFCFLGRLLEDFWTIVSNILLKLFQEFPLYKKPSSGLYLFCPRGRIELYQSLQGGPGIKARENR